MQKRVGGRSQAMAYAVVHALKGRLSIGGVPVFSTDGLKHYFYALTAHFGKWEAAEGKKPVWVLLSEFVYGQVVKHQRRRRTVAIERRILWGEEQQYQDRLKKAGLSGRINTAFVERINLTIRQCVSKLTRRTWGLAKYTPELMEYLKWVGGSAIVMAELLSFCPTACEPGSRTVPASSTYREKVLAGFANLTQLV